MRSIADARSWRSDGERASRRKSVRDSSCLNCGTGMAMSWVLRDFSMDCKLILGYYEGKMRRMGPTFPSWVL